MAPMRLKGAVVSMKVRRPSYPPDVDRFKVQVPIAEMAKGGRGEGLAYEGMPALVAILG